MDGNLLIDTVPRLSSRSASAPKWRATRSRLARLSRRGPPSSCSAASSCAPRTAGCTLAATDMELSLRASLDADVAAKARPSCPAGSLLDIARALPEPEVSIEHLPEESVLSITSGSASYRHPHVLAPRTSPGFPTSTIAAATGRRERRCSRRSAASAAQRRGTRAGRC